MVFQFFTGGGQYRALRYSHCRKRTNEEDEEEVGEEEEVRQMHVDVQSKVK